MNKIKWFGLSQVQTQTLLDLIEREIDDIASDVEEEGSLEYCKDLNTIYSTLASSLITQDADYLRAENHSLRNELTALKLEKQLKERKSHD